MKNFLLGFLFMGQLISVKAWSQNKKIVILGSSTAAGNGASTFDSSWARKLYFEFNKNLSDGSDTTITNLAMPGFVTYQIMPGDYIMPSNRTSWSPDPLRNVTQALSLSPNIIIINMPSNDVNLYPDYTMTETMNNFRLMFQRINAQGVKAFITTTQPRNDVSTAQKQMLRQLYDSIQNNFGIYTLDFWNDLVTNDGLNNLRDDRRTDNIHPNNIGHRLLFERVKAKNIFNPSLTNQNPVANAGADQNITGNSVQLNGSGSDAEGSVSFNWTRVSGPGQASITNASSAGTSVTGLVPGVHAFRLTVTDNQGASTSDEVLIFVYASVPGKLEAEYYTQMNGVQTENTWDAGGGLNVGWQDNGDWMDFNINVATAGNYTLNFRVATVNIGSQFQLLRTNGTVITTVNVPSTGGWQTWQTTSAQVSLPAGMQTIRIYTNNAAGGWNINWMEFLSASVPNQIPTANAGADQVITLPLNSVTLTGSGADTDGSIVSYQWTEVNGPNNAIISNANSAQTSMSGLIAGNYLFRLRVTDNGGASATDDVAIQVNPANQIPSQIKIEAEDWLTMSGVQKEPTQDVGGGLDVGSQDPNDWEDYSINLSSAGSYTMNFRIATMVSGAQFLVKNENGIVLATLNVPNTGSYQTWQTISATVSLPAGPQVIRISTVTSPAGWNMNWLQIQSIGGTNIAPTVNAGADQTITLPANSVTVNGTASDADGTIASYQWSQLTGPANATIANATSASTTISALVQGTYTFQLKATDNAGASSTDDIIINVNAASVQQTIRIEAENYSAMYGIQKDITSDVGGGQNVGGQDLNDWVEYSVNLASAGTYTLNFRIATMVAGAKFEVRNSTGTALATVSVPSTGTYQTWQTISTQVTLPAGQQTIRIFTIASPAGWNFNWWEIQGGSSGTNQTPVVNAGPDQTITLPANSVTVNGTASDADGSIVSYQWSQLTGPANATIANATSASTTISALVQGTYTFRLKATDNAGASATDDIIIVVNPAVVQQTIRIEAENYSAMFGVNKESTADVGGGQNVGGQDLNDWVEYSVTLAAAGIYTLNFRIATMVAGAQFQVRKSDGTVLATVAVPSTGTYQTWQTISTQVTLPAGQQTLRIFTIASPAGWNFNWWEIQGGTVTIRQNNSQENLSLENSSDAQLYPNPASNRTILSINNGMKGMMVIELMDQAGRLKKQWKVNKENALFNQEIETGDLPKGTYFIRINMKGRTESRKLIIL